MKHLLGGVAIGAVIAFTAPVWAQQNPNTSPPAATPSAPAPQTPQARPTPQAQAPAQQQPMTAMPANKEAASGHGGMRYAMSHRRHHWRHARAWRMHHHWRYAHARRGHHRHWAYRHRGWGYGPAMAWTGNWQAPPPTQYYGASTAPMAYSASAGGTVLWYPPGSRVASPPGFPPPFWFW